MTEQEIIDKVYQFFIDAYGIKFNGNVEAKIDGGFYEVKIYLNEQYFIPLYIIYETDDAEDFIKYLYKDLRNRNLYMHGATKTTSIKLTPDLI